MIKRIAILGAGNGGKAAAADLALQGKQVSLYEFPEYERNLEPLLETRRLAVTGAIQGEAELERVTSDLAEAIADADTVMICTQASTHDRTARELAPLIRPDQLVVLNPGSTGGGLHMARVFREAGMRTLPRLAEFSTLTYGARARGAHVDVAVKVRCLFYGTLPGTAIGDIGPDIEPLFPGLRRARNVLHAGLNNANPVIHPPIALLNGARFENDGAKVYFYRDGVSPAVARLIEKLDGERMALLRALGYPAQPDPVTSVEQGYAASTNYFECYAKGPGFISFTGPDTLDHRYFHEDVGMGLVLYCSLGAVLGVATPTADAFVRMASAILGIDYFAKGARTVKTLGLDGLSQAEIHEYLETGRRGDPK